MPPHQGLVCVQRAIGRWYNLEEAQSNRAQLSSTEPSAILFSQIFWYSHRKLTNPEDHLNSKVILCPQITDGFSSLDITRPSSFLQQFFFFSDVSGHTHFYNFLTPLLTTAQLSFLAPIISNIHSLDSSRLFDSLNILTSDFFSHKTLWF